MNHEVHLHLDLETRSACDLKKCGLHVYAQDPSTEILMCAWAFDEESIQIWFPHEPVPTRIIQHIQNGGAVWGHNVNFEMELINKIGIKYGWPTISIDQSYCTMSMAYAMSLPGSLEKASAAVGLTIQKDMEGSRIMLQLCKPRKIHPNGSYEWWEDEEKTRRLAEYCKTDVEVERLLQKRLMNLSVSERQIWKLDNKINSRGVYVNLREVRFALDIVEFEKNRLDREMRRVTVNAVATCNATGQLTHWIREHDNIKVESIAKADVLSLLDKDISPTVRSALMLRQEASKTSTAKLRAMLFGTCEGRLKGLFQYHGAHTGRFSGRRVQLQNLPRGELSPKEVEGVFNLFRGDAEESRDWIDMLYGKPLSVISSCIRGFIQAPPGKVLMACDFSAIEARVLAWLAGEERVLEIFRGHGKIYEHAASGIYKVPIDSVTKGQRQIGKVAVLALGFQGGVGAFAQMARGYGVKVTDAEADEIKTAWRNNHPHIVKYWYNLEYAATNAVRYPGSTFSIGSSKFKQAGSFLFCKLPSGRILTYPYPQLQTTITPWGTEKEGLTYMSEDPLTHKWERQKTYGGKLSENLVQAVARDLLTESMIRLESSGYTIVAHAHDEVICEV
jgi:DNA polymerase